jgi:hypothetical protein
MFSVPNIDQMYKEIVEFGNKHGNGNEFLDFADLFFFGITNVRVGGKILGSNFWLGWWNDFRWEFFGKFSQQ